MLTVRYATEFLLAGSPQMCAGIHGSRLIRIDDEGSSPQVWGIQRLPKLYIEENRITPASVRNALYNAAIGVEYEDHPCGCGKYSDIRASRP